MRAPTETCLGAAGAIALAFLSGCGAPGEGPPPLRVPAISVVAGPHAGTGLTGPLPAAGPVGDSVALGLRCRGLWVESPVVAGESLDPHLRLVFAPGESEPLRPVARRAVGVGFARGPAAADLVHDADDGRRGRTEVAWDESGALEAGTAFRVATSGASGTDADALVLDVSRATGSAEARVVLQLLARAGAEPEMLVLAEPLRPDDGPLAFVFPRTARADEPAALVVVLGLAPPGARPAARPDVSTSAAAAAERRRALSQAEEESREIRGVLADLDRPAQRRARLVFLTSTCGAPLALDVALIAQDADLAELAEAVKTAIPEPRDRASSAWPIESAAWRMLARKAAAGAIAPELSGVLTRQGGEAARFSGAIEDLVRGIDSVEALTSRLVSENRILLEDASPSARLRAYDWLAARGSAPAGFDPLAPLAERRAALRKAAEAEEASARPAGEPR